MRWIALAATALLLGACGGIIDRCPNGLTEAPWGSSIPSPHSPAGL